MSAWRYSGSPCAQPASKKRPASEAAPPAKVARTESPKKAAPAPAPAEEEEVKEAEEKDAAEEAEQEEIKEEVQKEVKAEMEKKEAGLRGRGARAPAAAEAAPVVAKAKCVDCEGLEGFDEDESGCGPLCKLERLVGKLKDA